MHMLPDDPADDEKPSPEEPSPEEPAPEEPAPEKRKKKDKKQKDKKQKDGKIEEPHGKHDIPDRKKKREEQTDAYIEPRIPHELVQRETNHPYNPLRDRISDCLMRAQAFRNAAYQQKDAEAAEKLANIAIHYEGEAARLERMLADQERFEKLRELAEKNRPFWQWLAEHFTKQRQERAYKATRDAVSKMSDEALWYYWWEIVRRDRSNPSRKPAIDALREEFKRRRWPKPPPPLPPTPEPQETPDLGLSKRPAIAAIKPVRFSDPKKQALQTHYVNTRRQAQTLSSKQLVERLRAFAEAAQDDPEFKDVLAMQAYVGEVVARYTDKRLGS